MPKISFRWREGFIVVYSSPEGLVVEAENSRLVFGQRQVSIEGLFEGIREYEEQGRAALKTVYIDLAWPLRGRAHGEGTIYQREVDTSIGGYGISYTPLDEAGYFLTIYPPSGSLYDHAVVAEDKVAIVMLKRRHIYMMEEEGRRTLIMV